MRILLTGGGTGGHILPHASLIDVLRKHSGLQFLYIGSNSGLEEAFCKSQNIEFKSVATGKLRRYFSFQNFVDIFKIPLGVMQSFAYILKFKPDVIFSKGGYVALPVVIAGALLHRRIIIHESDFTPGCATRMSAVFAQKICVATKQTKEKFSLKIQRKVVVTGNPIRPEILKGTRENAFKFLKGNSRNTLSLSNKSKPILLIMGGSTGALAVNEMVWENLDELLKKYIIIHVTGKGKNKAFQPENYFSFEYIDKELKDIYAIADMIICRSGAGTVSEINALGLPAIYIPLPSASSRGDQFENAKYMSETYSEILDQNSTGEELMQALKKLESHIAYNDKKTYKTSGKKIDPSQEIVKIILD